MLADVRRRDELDSTRQTSPLHAAADAVVLDTDELSVDAVLAELLRLVKERGLVTMSSSRDLPPDAWPWLHDLARWVGTWLFGRSTGCGCTTGERIPATGPVVVVANHSAFVDGPLLFGLLGRRAVFLVKQEMFTGVARLGAARGSGSSPCAAGEADRRPLTAARRRCCAAAGSSGCSRRAPVAPATSRPRSTGRRGWPAPAGRACCRWCAGAPGRPRGRAAGGGGRGSTCWWGSR